MKQERKIERLEGETLRQREKIDSLQKENSALKEALADKERMIEELQSKWEDREAVWEKHLQDTAEAIEEAAEARLAYEAATEEVTALKKEYRRGMEQLVGMIKRTAKGKAV